MRSSVTVMQQQAASVLPLCREAMMASGFMLTIFSPYPCSRQKSVISWISYPPNLSPMSTLKGG